MTLKNFLGKVHGGKKPSLKDQLLHSPFCYIYCNLTKLQLNWCENEQYSFTFVGGLYFSLIVVRTTLSKAHIQATAIFE